MSPRSTSQPHRPNRKVPPQVHKRDEQLTARSAHIDHRTLFVQAHLSRDYFSPYSVRR